MVSSKSCQQQHDSSPSWVSYHVIVFILVHVACVVSDRHLRSSAELIVQNVTSRLNVLSGCPADRYCRWFFLAIGIDECGAKKDELIVAVLTAGDLVRDAKSDEFEVGRSHEGYPGEQLTCLPTKHLGIHGFLEMGLGRASGEGADV
jgi:hypothetical protein